MGYKVFVDGAEGTTGLQIFQRLEKHGGVELIKIDSENRKDVSRRAALMNSADIVFLCLPDAAAIEAAGMVTNSSTRIIDASTAHRTNPDWVYGFPEKSQDRRKAIANARFVANPGCHATGFISVVAPLVQEGLLAKSAPICCHSITGYSGGGKKMIAEYESENRSQELKAPRHYGLNLTHKHLPEMMNECMLTKPPVFVPIVADYYAGISCGVQLAGIDAMEVHQVLENHYKGEHFIKVMEFGEKAVSGGKLNPDTLAGTNNLEIFVFGNENGCLAVSRFDNLGKGASGAAVQNMNIMLGLDEATGLE